MRVLLTIICQEIWQPWRYGQLLETYSLPNLNQKDLDHLNTPITRNETEYVIQILPTNKSPAPCGFTGEFFQTYEERILILKILQKFKEEGKQSYFFSFTLNSVSVFLFRTSGQRPNFGNYCISVYQKRV